MACSLLPPPPFRDCSMRRMQQHECNNQVCKAWRAELNDGPGNGHHGNTGANGTAARVAARVALLRAQRQLHDGGAWTPSSGPPRRPMESRYGRSRFSRDAV